MPVAIRFSTRAALAVGIALGAAVAVSARPASAAPPAHTAPTLSSPTPTPACQAQLDRWCASPAASCASAIVPRGCADSFHARRDTDLKGDADAWRCYSTSALTPDGSHYDTQKKSSCYCSRDGEITAQINNPSCGEPPSPATTGIDVMVAGQDSPFYGCFRIPALVRAPTGDLLAFAEGRHPGCEDHQWNDLVVKRSTDGGHTWGPSNVTVVYGESTPTSFVTCGNPAPVVDATTNTLLLPFCRNNKEVLLLESTDWGHSWSDKPRNLSPSVVPKDWTWVATGPPGGIQLASGRLVVPSDWGTGSGGGSHAMISDDHGKTWSNSALIPNGNECQAAVTKNGSLIMSMRTPKPHRQWSVSSDGGSTWAAPTSNPAINEVACEGSIVALPDFPGGELLVLSSAFDTASRSNMTLHVSRDSGASFTPLINVYPGESAYSSLVALNATSVGLLWEKDGYKMLTYKEFDLEQPVMGMTAGGPV